MNPEPISVRPWMPGTVSDAAIFATYGRGGPQHARGERLRRFNSSQGGLCIVVGG